METFNVFSVFRSIDGECNYYAQGYSSIFVRFSGCNLWEKPCSYCDTKYAISPYCEKKTKLDELISRIESFKIKKVTITGGEPLFQENLEKLIDLLLFKKYKISIETNGTIPILKKDVSWIIDYKLKSSGVSEHNFLDNFESLSEKDFVKFVICNNQDLEQAIKFHKYLLSMNSKCKIAYSPVFNNKKMKINFIDRLLNTDLEFVLNIQLHKLIDLEENK